MSEARYEGAQTDNRGKGYTPREMLQLPRVYAREYVVPSNSIPIILWRAKEASRASLISIVKIGYELVEGETEHFCEVLIMIR